MRSQIAGALLILLLSGVSGGCAEFMGTAQTVETPLQKAMAERAAAVDKARAALRDSKAQGGETAAPFEYYMAQEYLQLAEHELGGGDKNGVVEFAEKSRVHAMKATEIARGEKK